jgi:serine/threonine protein kinase
MAAVYLAHELALDRKVAMKVMSPALLTNQGMIERFEREARTVAKLNHPNIVALYAVRQVEDLHFFTMQFVEGRSLDHILFDSGPLPIRTVRNLLFTIGNALAYAHRRGVVHRDVKPANILVNEEGSAVVTDFGNAKVAQDTTGTYNQTNTLVGTPAYISPEQCYGYVATAASDQYSLGILAYELLTGHVPFAGTPSSYCRHKQSAQFFDSRESRRLPAGARDRDPSNVGKKPGESLDNDAARAGGAPCGTAPGRRSGAAGSGRLGNSTRYRTSRGNPFDSCARSRGSASRTGTNLGAGAVCGLHRHPRTARDARGRGHDLDDGGGAERCREFHAGHAGDLDGR